MSNLISFTEFQRRHWNYFLDLENEFLETKKYVEFDKSNFDTYSIKYLLLLQAICGEIDTVGKVIAEVVDNTIAKEKKVDINSWWFRIQVTYPKVYDKVISKYDLSFQPWDNFKVTAKNKIQNGNVITNYVLDSAVKGVTPKWWAAYNKAKHQRTDNNLDNYRKANLENVFNALSALYVIEYNFMKNNYEKKETNNLVPSKIYGLGELEIQYFVW